MKILVIQTSFLGDVITATAVVEKLHHVFPAAHIDMMVRKGNESLLENHPVLSRIWIWEKGEKKIANLWKLALQIRKAKYDVVINLHRFFSTGLITVLSGAKDTRGFRKNPLSAFFIKVFPHVIGNGTTEYQRNQRLIADLTDMLPARPKLYPSKPDFEKIFAIVGNSGRSASTDRHSERSEESVASDQGIRYDPKIQNDKMANKGYICIAPASVWFTKQLPAEKWVELINRIPKAYKVFLTGSKDDFAYSEKIIKAANHEISCENLCGRLSLLQSAALMQGAAMNYVNDSAALHLCSAMNAPVTAFYLSTVPRFGFVPVSENAAIIETSEKLDCRPCGLHGYQQCPKGHFKCALTIDMAKVVIPGFHE